MLAFELEADKEEQTLEEQIAAQLDVAPAIMASGGHVDDGKGGDAAFEHEGQKNYDSP